jgi:hypothetical protein
MTPLRFAPTFRSPELREIDVPVEVRTSKLKVVARTTSSQVVDLEPGEYFVSAVLPGGRELIGSVEVGGAPAVVELLSDFGDEPPADEMLERKHFLAPPVGDDADERQRVALETLGPSRGALAVPLHAPVTLRQLTGNVLRGDVVVQDEVTVQPKDGQRIPLYPDGSLRPAYVQMTQTHAAPVTLAVPSGPGRMSEVLFRQEGSHWTLDLHLAHAAANLLLCYRANGYVQQAAEATESPALNAEQLLEEKIGDPIAAAVGAYALLRFAELRRLRDWTENLRAWFPWLPDGSAIRGEHLARMGEHTQALEVFLELHDRGLPMFTDGFAFALDRLRLYLEAGLPTAPEQHSAARALLEKLKRIAPAVDDGSPVLVIVGDPLELLARNPDPTAAGATPQAAAPKTEAVRA